MSAKWSNYSLPLRLAAGLCIALRTVLTAYAEPVTLSAISQVPSDTIQYLLPKKMTRDTASLANERYRHTLERINRFWTSLTPNQVKIQYAGDMGLVSIGPGWHYGHDRRVWATDLMFGYLPAYHTHHSKLILTLRQTYAPFRVRLGDNVNIDPLATGLYLTTIFSDQFWAKEPDKYPKKYYGFSTKIRANVFLGQRLRYEIPQMKRMQHKAVIFYYDVSTNDLYLASCATNKYISLWDILVFDVGLSFEFY